MHSENSEIIVSLEAYSRLPLFILKQFLICVGMLIDCI